MPVLKASPLVQGREISRHSCPTLVVNTVYPRLSAFFQFNEESYEMADKLRLIVDRRYFISRSK